MEIGKSKGLKYSLVITGLDYNPVPYKRTTQRQKWVDKEYKKYQEWKIFLMQEFAKQNRATPALKGRHFVEVVATYKNKKHGDTDNVAKGINDALFANDKLVSGSYEFNYSTHGGIDVKIYELSDE